MQLKEAIRRLREFQARVSAPHDFYAAHRERWEQAARKLVSATVRNVRPPDADAISWDARAETLAAQVSATLLPAGEGTAGMVIAVSERLGDVKETDPNFFSTADVGIQDLLRFIAAGRAGEPNGKRLDERDDNRTDLQIAWRMMYAIKKRKGGWERLREHVHVFLGATIGGGEADKLAGAIIQVWTGSLVPKARADYVRWLGAQVRALG